LDLVGGVQGVDHTTELDEEAVARGFHKPAVMRGDRRVDYLGADGPEPPERAGFVRADQSRIAGDICCQDGGKAAGRGHSSGIPALRRPTK